MSSERAAAADFEQRVGEIKRTDAAAYVVDGRAAEAALVPGTVEELCQALAAANEAGLVVVPWGGGTQIGLGNLPERVDVALDLKRLDQVVAYEPDDLTASVQAGCTLAEFNRVLGEHGQMLPVDAADPERATIGGLVAAGMSGPRRFGYAPLRDLIIGITVSHADGRLAKGGGMVVKNVTGFDMMRLHHGALGSLAVIVQVNFKVLPRPRAGRTVLARYGALEPAVAAAEGVRQSQLSPTAIALLDGQAASRADLGDAAWTLVLRCEAPPSAVVRQAERIGDAVAAGATDLEVVEEEATEQVWAKVNQALAAAASEDEVAVRLGAPPSALGDLAARTESVARAHGLGLARTLDFGGGLLYLRLSGGDPIRYHGAWRHLQEMGQHATIIAAPVGVKQGIDVFGREPAGFDVMRALKAQFDPNRILNRGRFVGHL